MPEDKIFQKRQTAYKVSISHILTAPFEKDDLSSAFVRIGSLNVSRVNLIGTIVYVSDQGNYSAASIDDGTGRISLRSFESSLIFSKIEVGDIVLVVGKVREFSSEKYVIPEIIKKLYSIEWMSVRKAELEKMNFAKAEDAMSKEDSKNLNEQIYQLIKKIDSGDGAAIEEILKISSSAEKAINRLLENGDVFEVRPGLLRVLE